MIDHTGLDARMIDMSWHEVPMTIYIESDHDFNSHSNLVAWCLKHSSNGLFRSHFTLKYPVYQGSFWFEQIEDAIEFKMRWL